MRAHWRNVYNLAWHGKGGVIDLTHLPSDLIEQMIEWHNQNAEAENEKQKGG